MLVKNKQTTSENKLNYFRNQKVILKMCIKFLEESRRIHFLPYICQTQGILKKAGSSSQVSLPMKQALIQPENPAW